MKTRLIGLQNDWFLQRCFSHSHFLSFFPVTLQLFLRSGQVLACFSFHAVEYLGLASSSIIVLKQVWLCWYTLWHSSSEERHPSVSIWYRLGGFHSQVLLSLLKYRILEGFEWGRGLEFTDRRTSRSYDKLFPIWYSPISHLNIHWKDWCWSWSCNTLVTWCDESTHWKRPWCWETLKAGGKGDGRGWDGWMAPSTQRTWVWAKSGRQWRTGKPGMLPSTGSQRIEHDWVAERRQFHTWTPHGFHGHLITFGMSLPSSQKKGRNLTGRENQWPSLPFIPLSLLLIL